MTDYSDWIDLASERFGGRVLYANDQFFAPKENLIKAKGAVFLPDRFTERGKWMDGWESRRRREPGHDSCILRLGATGILRGLDVDTTHFKGNYPEACSVQGALIDGYPDPRVLAADDRIWFDLVSKSPLRGDQSNWFAIKSKYAVNHLRLNIYPDGGVARLRAYGRAVVRLGRLPVGSGLVDLAAAEHGGRVIRCSDMFFGARHNLILPGDARNMGEGWETRRRRDDDHDWVIVQLAARGQVERILVDTSHFMGNAPARFVLEVADVGESGPSASTSWQKVLDVPLRRHTKHLFIDEVVTQRPATYARAHIFPDGGLARLRLYCSIEEKERLQSGLRWLCALPDARAISEFSSCCACRAWAKGMAGCRPFADPSELFAAADRLWRQGTEKDWLEAFEAHPKIGEGKRGTGQSARWSQREQAKAQQADQKTRAAILEKSKSYEAKFGFVFLICASGKSAEEILQSLERRLTGSRSSELSKAAEEQRQITQLRLRRLLLS